MSLTIPASVPTTEAATSATQKSNRELIEQAMRHSWFPVARSADLTPGGTPQPATLLGSQLVVYRDGQGRASVASRRCPHRGADLSLGKVHDASIGCPYHGWQYASGDGLCVRVPSIEDQSKIPPKAKLQVFPVEERYGLIWTALEEPIEPLYRLPEWEREEFTWLQADPLDSPVGVAVTVENFRDVAHFPFVHQVSMGPTPEVVEPLQVSREGSHVWMFRPLNAGTGEWAGDGDCEMQYHCVAPGLSSITYDYAKLGRRVVAGFPSPISFEHVKIFWGVANATEFTGAPIEENLRLEEMVYLEDIPIVENNHPREVPWDAEIEEFSAPADVFTLNYRRAFLDLARRTEETLRARDTAE
ncbi:phenylpropionate dioxygenase-like ring-hydroxylating dioxygenase large terminal subunit [Leucobacter luti]|uniref:Phenylpropionate dioxygenase-like ring-hydroxylating dioxygenase large terminal subunit n=1 Tax=Leucobacter luti TaxID=340320 RepID=A0A4R6RY19_9MICO|nr:Rieske 2Fe-2S domain-containing protein [Leucobacter luti]TDP91467.1 phenylpropionate dioxygenase-like ring-hydroxylating dioxygenase large terminal subunit [Leucobacter luti]